MARAGRVWLSVRAIHVIEGWWDGACGESATDAASACCASWMRDRPGDVAVVLGPAQAAARVRAAGVRVAAAWSPPLGLNGLAQRPLRRIVDDLASGGGFAGAIVWTPGAMAAAVGLGLPLTDMTTGAAWAAATPTPLMSAGEARQALCDEMGVCADEVLLVGAIADPPGRCDALLAMYGVALADGAGLMERLGRRGVLVVPFGARGVERAASFAAGIGQDLMVHSTGHAMGPMMAGLDLAMMMPTGSDAATHLTHARSWWVRTAAAVGTKTIVSQGEVGTASVPAWGRADLGRAVGRVISAMPAGASS